MRFRDIIKNEGEGAVFSDTTRLSKEEVNAVKCGTRVCESRGRSQTHRFSDPPGCVSRMLGTGKVQRGRRLRPHGGIWGTIAEWGSKRVLRGQPGGVVVGFLHSSSAAWGSLVQILGTDLHTAYQAMLGWCPT